MAMEIDPKFDVEITQSKLTTYFSARPNNFKLERFLGSGAGANAWLVRHRKQAGDRWGRIVVKTPLGISESGYDEDPFGVGFGVEEFQAERKLLEVSSCPPLLLFLLRFGHPVATLTDWSSLSRRLYVPGIWSDLSSFAAETTP